MIAALVEWLGIALLGLGMIFVAIAAVGVARLPDVYCRCHALGKAFTLGINALLLGLWCKLGDATVGLKVGLVMAFLSLTIPVSTHLLTRLAWRSQAPRHEGGATPEEETR